MKRRNFLRAAGALSLPSLLTGGIAASPVQLFSQFVNPDSNKILVLIRLSGGNDGLNTLIGIDQLENLRQVRPTVALPDNEVLSLTDTTGLHPSMTGMKELFDNGMLSAVQAVGYPNQNRSHFRSTDIWTSASSATDVVSTGWLGRYLNEDHPTYPTGYPNSDSPHPLAVVTSNTPSETCQGSSINYNIAVDDPINFLRITPGGNTVLPVGTRFGEEVSFVRDLIGQSNSYGAVVEAAAKNGDSLATTYTSGELSAQLRDIALMISGGLQTKIYVATIRRFDTHSQQVISSAPTTGTHAGLLRELSDSIKAFQDDLQLLGIADRVAGLTFSEFGRQIKQNSSNGTDHGSAAPLFAFGNCVQGGILGANPVIDPAVGHGAGVPYQYDFRDVYGSVLMDWFDVPETTVRNLVYPNFSYLPIFNGCAAVLPVELINVSARGLEKSIQLEWSTSREVDNIAFFVERGTNGRDFKSIGHVPPQLGEEAIKEYSFSDRQVSNGPQYYYRLRQEDRDGTLTYSPIQTAKLRGAAKGEWSLSSPRPNPVTEESYLSIYAPQDSTADFEITDVRGQRLRTGVLTLPGGVDTRVRLQPGGLVAGTYLYRLLTKDGRQFTAKFIKP